MRKEGRERRDGGTREDTGASGPSFAPTLLHSFLSFFLSLVTDLFGLCLRVLCFRARERGQEDWFIRQAEKEKLLALKSKAQAEIAAKQLEIVSRLPFSLFIFLRS